MSDLKRVHGKTGLLFQLARVSLDEPKGIIEEVIYPVVDENTLNELVKEWRASGSFYQSQVQTRIRSSYRSHYRRMLAPLLDTLNFCSNNTQHQPVIEAMALIKRHLARKITHYPEGETVPLEGAVPKAWMGNVVERDSQGRTRINRLTYEVCVLQTLQRQLRCKEVWIHNADRYRNPDLDLPDDFDDRRDQCYRTLGLEPDAQSFIKKLKQELHDELIALDRSMPRNSDVQLLDRAGGWIKLSPLPPQPEPENLAALKADVANCWPMTGLLDVLKETDLRVGFTNAFHSPTPREHLNRSEKQTRILLCLYVMGTNAGLGRIAAGQDELTYKDLQYARNWFITKEQLRLAIAQVVNHTLRARRPSLWGDGTSACASDARAFGAWDQNLLTEWHRRYGGRAVQIYWHVERGSMCIHSYLKSVSSSEVSAMIQGVLHHCTEMEVDRQYVDSNGQSTVGFAFC